MKTVIAIMLGLFCGMILAYYFPAHAQESQSEFYARVIEPYTSTAPDSYQHSLDSQMQHSEEMQREQETAEPQYVPYYDNPNPPADVYSTPRY